MTVQSAVTESVERRSRMREIGRLVPGWVKTNDLLNIFLSFPSLAFGIVRIVLGLVNSVSA